MITGFKNGIDHIALRGYTASATMSSIGGNTTITLSDHTEITLLGIANLSPNTFV